MEGNGWELQFSQLLTESSAASDFWLAFWFRSQLLALVVPKLTGTVAHAKIDKYLVPQITTEGRRRGKYYHHFAALRTLEEKGLLVNGTSTTTDFTYWKWV